MKNIHSFLKVNYTYRSLSNHFMDHLQSLFDNHAVLLPVLKIIQKVKLLNPEHKDIKFIIKEQLSTDRCILLTKSFNHNIELTISYD